MELQVPELVDLGREAAVGHLGIMLDRGLRTEVVVVFVIQLLLWLFRVFAPAKMLIGQLIRVRLARRGCLSSMRLLGSCRAFIH